jgi:hypothetical protein
LKPPSRNLRIRGVISFATTVLLSFSNCSDGGRVDYATLQKKLSPFQLEKLTYLFRCLFDCNQDGVIDVSFKDFNFKNYKKVTIRIRTLFMEFNLFFSSKAMTSF